MNTFISAEFSSTLVRFFICLVINWVVIDRLYFRKSHRRDFYFTFLIMTVAIFFLVYFMMSMERGKATMGVGLGLFGIFSIMRYRTDTMPVREMTYLFVIICLSVVHAMADSYMELALVDVLTVLTIWLGERSMKPRPTKLIQYDRIELVHPDRRQELVADLEKRLGLKVTSVEVGAVDFLKDMAMLRVGYEAEGQGNSVDQLLHLTKSQKQEF